MAELEGWEADKGRYYLAQLPPGVFVYSLSQRMNRPIFFIISARPVTNAGRNPSFNQMSQEMVFTT